MIRKCDCKHEFQDKKYGKGKRVFTKSSAKNDEDSRATQGKNRCTVCGRILK